MTSIHMLSKKLVRMVWRLVSIGKRWGPVTYTLFVSVLC